MFFNIIHEKGAGGHILFSKGKWHTFSQTPVKRGDARSDYRFDVLVFQSTNIANKDEEFCMKYKVQD